VYFSDFILLLFIKGISRFLREESLALKIEIFIFVWQIYSIHFITIKDEITNIVRLMKPLIIFIRVTRIFQMLQEFEQWRFFVDALVTIKN